MFNEICIYEAKIEMQDEIETLMKEVAEFYLSQPGVVDVKYIKRTHRQEDFNAVKEGRPPIRLTRWVGKVTYILHWTLENEEAHARVSKLGLEQFYKRWNRCLTTIVASLQCPKFCWVKILCRSPHWYHVIQLEEFLHRKSAGILLCYLTKTSLPDPISTLSCNRDNGSIILCNYMDES